MGWIKKIITTVAGKAPDDWTFVQGIPMADSQIAGRPIQPDECYIELYVDSLKLARKRRFATTFNGVVYAFGSTAVEGAPASKFSAVTQPQELAKLGETDLNNVITFAKRMFKVVPWRGDPLDLELGLFSVKTGNVAADLADYVVRLSNTIAPGIASTYAPVLPLVTEGLNMLAGQTDDVALELAVDTSLQLTQGQHYALIRKTRDSLNTDKLTVTADGLLLDDGTKLDASYCIFSIRPRPDNPDWGGIESLRTSYGELTQTIAAGKQKDAEDALAAFRRAVVVCPDLITADKKRVIRKAQDVMEMAFAGGQVAAAADAAMLDTPAGPKPISELSFADLDLYDKL